MRRRKPPTENELAETARAIEMDPSDATVRAQYAAALIRAGYYVQAEEQLDVCLALCPPGSRRRLLVVVLRARLRNALRRGRLWDHDVDQLG